MVNFFVLFVVVSLVAFCAYRLGQENPHEVKYDLKVFWVGFDPADEEFNVEEGSWV